MTPQALPLPFDPSTLVGLSEKLLRSHHHNNYQGAVARLQTLRSRWSAAAVEKLPGFEINGLKREELIATNSMLLHELYFDSLGASDMAPAMALALAGSFGSVQRWRDEFVSMAKALSGGSGWVLLGFQPREGTLVNQWAADHTQTLAGGVPLLALDMYEHAYHMDFGSAVGPYIDAFMSHIAWAKVYERYQAAVHGASERLGTDADSLQGQRCVVLDVRRDAMYHQARSMLPGARWCDPASVAQWGPALPPDQPVVVYCIYGHEVGRSTALKLRAMGVNASFLIGGIDQWVRQGRAVQAKEPRP